MLAAVDVRWGSRLKGALTQEAGAAKKRADISVRALWEKVGFDERGLR